MSNPNGLPIIHYGGAARYRITVQGELDANWSDRIAGMTITNTAGKKGESQTQLSGHIRDQAELSGVLETLYGLHLAIIRVEQIEEDD